MTHVQAVSSSSSSEWRSSKGTVASSPKGASSGHSKPSQMLSGSKSPRSPKDSSCGRYFCSSHNTSECHHQVVCLHCNGVGHVAPRCNAELRRSPHRQRLHIRSSRCNRLFTIQCKRSCKSRRWYNQFRGQLSLIECCYLCHYR